jgi:hypothetical protein
MPLVLFSQGVAAVDVGQIFGVKAQGDQLVVRVVDLNAATAIPDGRQVLVEQGQADQNLGAFTVLKDGRLILWSAVADASTGGRKVQLQTLGNSIELKRPIPAATLTLASPIVASALLAHIDLPNSIPEQPLGSLTEQPVLGLLALVGQRQDTPAFSLSVLDPATGATRAANVPLSPQARFSNLTTCVDGTLYGTSMASESGTLLVKLDVAQNQFVGVTQLQLDSHRLGRDLSGMVCSASGQLYALGDFARAGFNSLWRLDPSSGNLNLMQRFDVDRISYSN